MNEIGKGIESTAMPKEECAEDVTKRLEEAKKKREAERKKKAQADSKKKLFKKKLNYNHREISNMLLRAKRSQSAAAVLSTAKSKYASLKKTTATGQYNRREVANAINHARRMIQCAELKLRNLKEEERESKKQSQKGSMNFQKHKNQRKKQAHEKNDKKAKQLYQEQLTEIQREKRKQQELKQKALQNRTKELGKIIEANMKYQSGRNISEQEGAAVLLLNRHMPLSEEQIRKQLDRETAQEAVSNSSASYADHSTGAVGTVVDVEVGVDAVGTVSDTVAVEAGIDVVV